MAPVVLADCPKQDEKPAHVGTWARRDGEGRIEFVDKEMMKIAPHGDPAIISIHCKYTLDKDGLVKAQVTDFEGKEEFKEQIKKLLPAGSKFQFTLSVDKTKATIENLEGEEADRLKTHLEGKYDWKN
jgi:hypothetical protein